MATTYQTTTELPTSGGTGPHKLRLPKDIAPATHRQIGLKGIDGSNDAAEKQTVIALTMTRRRTHDHFLASACPVRPLQAALGHAQIDPEAYFTTVCQMRYELFPGLLRSLELTLNTVYLGEEHDRRRRSPWSWEIHEPHNQYDLANRATLVIPTGTPHRPSLYDIASDVLDCDADELGGAHLPLAVKVSYRSPRRKSC